jgi:hypothetical protein
MVGVDNKHKFYVIYCRMEGLTQAQLNRAHLNNGTKLPAGLTGVEDGKR